MNELNGPPGDGPPGDKPPKGDPSPFRAAIVTLLNPVPLVALTMIAGVMFLLAAAIFNFDVGHVLTSMGHPEFARGLITYLFTIVTIGTAIVLIISALLGGDKEHFDRGKEILGLLLGVFGTMVGFYFGSAQVTGHKLTVSGPLLSASEAVSGSQLTVTALIQGGAAPYHFGIAADVEPTTMDRTPRSDGWIVGNVVVPEVESDRAVTVSVSVVDSDGTKSGGKAVFTAKPKPK